MRGRKSTLKIEIDPATQAQMQALLRATTTKAGLAKRVRAMLLLAEGQSFTQTAHLVGLAERHVRKWAKRFVAQGLAGLHDLPRPGRKPAFSP